VGSRRSVRRRSLYHCYLLPCGGWICGWHLHFGLGLGAVALITAGQVLFTAPPSFGPMFLLFGFLSAYAFLPRSLSILLMGCTGVGLAVIFWTQDGWDPPIAYWSFVAILMATVTLVVAQLVKRAEDQTRRANLANDQLKASQRLLRKYAPAAVARRIESGHANAVGQPQRLRVTALSSDVAGFTALADQIDPESLSQIINEYMAAMSDAVESQGGVVTEFAGDGLMAIFGAPEPLEPEDQVRSALSSAKAMHARLADLNKTWFRLGIEQPLRVRIGINTGMLSVGTFGSDGRATYTAIGLQMNVAARIQAHCEPGSILLSSASWHLIKDDVDCDSLGEITVKGVHFPISIYGPRIS
jgi:class 3 adenylate cyclase